MKRHIREQDRLEKEMLNWKNALQAAIEIEMIQAGYNAKSRQR